MTDNPLLRARDDQADTGQERNRQWWERLPMTYERWENEDRSTTRQRVIDKFLSGNPCLTRAYFAQFAGKHVLEIGCGAGPASCLFAESGAHVMAIDLTDAAVEMTRKHTAGLGVTVERMDAERMTLPYQSVDHVFSWGVMHHSHPPNATSKR